ncbi:MAG: hypothetical protein ABIJ00_09760 [Candidatus Eisenbacteria bacterium]
MLRQIRHHLGHFRTVLTHQKDARLVALDTRPEHAGGRRPELGRNRLTRTMHEMALTIGRIDGNLTVAVTGRHTRVAAICNAVIGIGVHSSKMYTEEGSRGMRVFGYVCFLIVVVTSHKQDGALPWKDRRTA